MSEEDDSTSRQRLELYSFDLISCPSHPGFGVEVFCTRENFQPALLCIKCILDPEISREIRGISLIAIRDIITKSVEKTNLVATMQANQPPNESLEQRYLEFDRKDFIKILERHVENQMKKLDRDIDKMKESLHKLREQFVHFFGRHTQMLLKHDEEIKKRMEQFILEKDELNKVSFYSVADLLKELSAMKNYKDYEKFVRLLHKRSNEPKEGVEDPLQKKIFDLMDRMKTQVLQVKGMKVDTSILEEMRERIESINIMDDAPSIGEYHPLDPKLETILEKLRKSDKKQNDFGYGSITPKKSQNKSTINSNKSSPFDFKNFHKTSSLLEILKQKFGLDKSDQLKSSNVFNSDKKVEKDHGNEIKNNNSKDLTTKGLFSLGTGTFGSASQQANTSEAPKPANSLHDKKMLLNSSSHDQLIIESETSEQDKLHDLNKDMHDQAKELAQTSGVHDKSIENNAYPQIQTNKGSNLNGYKASYSIDSQKDQEKNPINQNENGQIDENHLAKRRNSKTNMEIENLNSDEDHEDDKGIENLEEGKNVFLNENTPEYLISQLIDDKLNGFTVFQNSLREEYAGYSDEMFNKFTSQRWFQLSRNERDEYTEIAMSARPGIKEELKLHDTAEFAELRELANQKIKEVKRQS